MNLLFIIFKLISDKRSSGGKTGFVCDDAKLRFHQLKRRCDPVCSSVSDRDHKELAFTHRHSKCFLEEVTVRSHMSLSAVR